MPTSDNRATFTVELADIKFAASGDPEAKGALTVRGHAAVFNRKSHDLGGFRTVIAPGAFTKVLDNNPDVHLVWDHDTRYTLARTKNNTLELREDPYGLHIFARMAPVSYAKDLAILMERGDIDQMSFKCDIGADEWAMDADENVTRTIFEIDGLYDATICAQGAFPQTDSQLVASVHDARAQLAAAIEGGKVIRKGDNPDLVASRGENGDGIAPDEGAADVADHAARLAAMREQAEARFAQHSQP